MVHKPQSDAEHKERRIDLSLPQVAGSAVAAVAAAVMASQLGVYGTIVGAGVMSVVATCGGSVFQHFFRRTGEQIREVTVQVKHPAGRQVTVRTRETLSAPPRQEDDATRVLGTVGRYGDAGGADRTTVLRAVEPGADRTTVLRRFRPGGAGSGDGRPGEPRPGDASTDDTWSDARTHGTRVRGWKRSALAATGVFVLSMAGITVYEMVSGHDLGGGGRTTIGSVVGGERNGGTTSPSPASSDGTGQEGGPDRGDDGSVPEGGSMTAPGTDQGGGGSARPDPSGGDGPADDPAPTPSASGDASAPATATPTTPGADGTTPATPDPTGADEVPDQQGGAGTDAVR
ncbi:hypothetical protein [Streptomyces sp. JH34]|uniref:hypothetical protein n=1 Tax=Streptomyces sp. JH34 TaxID=2793633 RepID=UPI0023F6FE08|nr:hypothetical protein [Streptomyces sp. JH34]MDF6018337.1 hypothetical protein [Streptomyces sp. JH34]